MRRSPASSASLVRSELLGAHELLEAAIAGRHDADVHVAFFSATQRAEDVILQET